MILIARREGARPRTSGTSSTRSGLQPGRRSAGDQHADAAATRGRRADVLAVAHDRALLADAVVLPDRPQPPPERHGLHHRGRRSAIPGANAHIPPECAHAWPRCCARPAGAPSGSARTTTSRSTTCARARTKEKWPLHQGWDRFYGFLGGETNQWYPDLTVDNHYDRAAVHARRRATTSRRTSPTRRSRMIRDSQGDGAVAAVVHVVLPGRQPCAAPRPQRVHRQVQGPVRRRLRGVPRVGAAAHDREGHLPGGHGAD